MPRHGSQMTRTRLRARLRALDEWFFRRPDDPTRSWRGIVAADQPVVRVLRIGGCEFREMPRAHTVASGPGFPRSLAERLQRRGLGMEFFNYFAPTFETAPTTAEELRRTVQLDGPPDVVLMQVGVMYSYRPLLGFGRRRALVRDRVAVGLGRHVYAAYRVANPVFARGRPQLDYAGAQGLDGLVALLETEWPEARIVVLGLLPLWVEGPWDPLVQSRVSADVLERAAELGLDTLDLADVVPTDWRHRTANGLNLTEAGGERVAAALEPLVLESAMAPPILARAA